MSKHEHEFLEDEEDVKQKRYDHKLQNYVTKYSCANIFALHVSDFDNCELHT